jgi:DNA-3-methyladenine glycosylase
VPLTAAALPRRFFERPVVELAEALLGQLLVSGSGRSRCVGRIVETEAYGGQGVDPSAHSFRGPTPRCAVMFGAAGHAYVYATQGRCSCLNVSAEGDRAGKAVLIRAIEPLEGVGLMRRRRLARLDQGPTRTRLLSRRFDHELAAGPGRLCVCLRIDRSFDGLDLTRTRSPLRLLHGEAPDRVAWTRRVGLNPRSASHDWIWRAVDAGSPSLSRLPANGFPRRRRPLPAHCPC